MAEFETKDSGKREEYDSGMVRDTQDGKPRFDLLLPKGLPYSDQFLTRVSELLARGAEKYTDRNWEKASGDSELTRFKASAFRHLMQWMNDESDEDHAAAVVFNLLAYETTKWKIDNARTKEKGIKTKEKVGKIELFCGDNGYSHCRNTSCKVCNSN